MSHVSDRLFGHASWRCMLLSRTGVGEKKKTYATDSVVFVVIFRFLNHVSTDDGFVAVVLVGFVGDEVGLAEELLLVVLKLAHHLGRLEVCKSQALVCTAC